jgi:hypothetical protein
MSQSSGSEDKGNQNGVRGGGGGGGRGGRQQQGGEEIATKSLIIQSKRFYMDVKQNNRGRFVKLAEVALNGRKNRLFMSMRVCKELKETLDKFEKDDKSTEKTTESKEGNGIIRTETIVNEHRRYYVDLKENQRGTFLRITQLEVQTGNRNSIALPLQGMGQFRDALEELLDEYSEGFIEEEVDLPQSQSFRTDGKNFFFDPGHNSRGDFLKITELKPSIGVRNTIAISIKAIPQFTETLNKLYDDFKTLRSGDAEMVEGEDKTAAKDKGAAQKELMPPSDNGNNKSSPKKAVVEGDKQKA